MYLPFNLTQKHVCMYDLKKKNDVHSQSTEYLSGLGLALCLLSSSWQSVYITMEQLYFNDS